MAYACKTINSPVGELKLVASDTGLAAILWQDDDPGRVRLGPWSRTQAMPCSSKPSASCAPTLPAS